MFQNYPNKLQNPKSNQSDVLYHGVLYHGSIVHHAVYVHLCFVFVIWKDNEDVNMNPAVGSDYNNFYPVKYLRPFLKQIEEKIIRS